MTFFHGRPRHRGRRGGMALLVVIVLIGLFAALCQTLTLLVAMQHRQAFQHADQAQVHRLADAGLLRAVSRHRHDSDWSGETWKPVLSTGEPVTVQLRIQPAKGGTLLQAEVVLTTSRGRTLKSNQSLLLAVIPAPAVTESNLP